MCFLVRGVCVRVCLDGWCVCLEGVKVRVRVFGWVVCVYACVLGWVLVCVYVWVDGVCFLWWVVFVLRG